MELTTSTFYRTLQYGSLALSLLTIAGIGVLIYIAWDKDEDITGIVAPAILLTIVSTVIAVASGLMAGKVSRNSK